VKSVLLLSRVTVEVAPLLRRVQVLYHQLEHTCTPFPRYMTVTAACPNTPYLDTEMDDDDDTAVVVVVIPRGTHKDLKERDVACHGKGGGGCADTSWD
jgi:hypothetical protein